MNATQTIAIFGGAGLFFALQAAYWTLRSRRQRGSHRVEQRLRIGGRSQDVRDLPRGRRSWVGETRLGAHVDAVLAGAGLTMTADQFLAFGALVLAGVWIMVAATSGSLAAGLLLSLLCAAGAWIYLQGLREKRLRRINEQLPAALDVIRSALAAGRNFEMAMQVAAEEVADPLGAELRRCHERFEKGRPMTEALHELARRNTECDSMQTFVQAVLVLRQAGGNLVPVLENIIETLRANAAYESRYRALTSEGRVSGAILGALPAVVAAGVLLVQPGYMAVLVADDRGRLVLGAAFGLWAAGVLWLRRMTKPVR